MRPPQHGVPVELGAGEEVDLVLRSERDGRRDPPSPRSAARFQLNLEAPHRGDDEELDARGGARRGRRRRDRRRRHHRGGRERGLRPRRRSRCPGRQDELVRRVAAANPRTVVVVNAGAPVLLPWADDVAGGPARVVPGPGVRRRAGRRPARRRRARRAAADDLAGARGRAAVDAAGRRRARLRRGPLRSATALRPRRPRRRATRSATGSATRSGSTSTWRCRAAPPACACATPARVPAARSCSSTSSARRVARRLRDRRGRARRGGHRRGRSSPSRPSRTSTGSSPGALPPTCGSPRADGANRRPRAPHPCFPRCADRLRGGSLEAESRVQGEIVESVRQRSRAPLTQVRRPHPAGAGARDRRVAYLDNLKLLLVAVIIAGHGALAYSTLESAWPYQDIQEVRLGPVSDLVLVMVVIPCALFAMGLFFLISGLVTYGSMSRKGAEGLRARPPRPARPAAAALDAARLARGDLDLAPGRRAGAVVLGPAARGLGPAPRSGTDVVRRGAPPVLARVRGVATVRGALAAPPRPAAARRRAAPW